MTICKIIDLESLSYSALGLSKRWGGFLLEAATVCFYKQGHESGIVMNMGIREKNESMKVTWKSKINKNIEASWKEQSKITEHAAMALAIKVVESESSYTKLEQSSIGTGFDYWMGDDEEKGIFQKKARLEISGIMKETTTNTFKQRVKDKIKQTEKTAHLGLPGYVFVAEFSIPKGQYKEI